MTANLSTPDQLAADHAAGKVLQWWADAKATLEEIGRTARRIARHADHPDSPIFGRIDGDELDNFGGRLGDMVAELSNIYPAPLSAPADPTADLPASPEPEPLDIAPAVARADVAAASADRLARLSDERLAEMVRIGDGIKADHALPAEAVESSLMPAVQAAALAFVRQFFPDALMADLSVVIPTGDDRHKHYSVPVLTWRHAKDDAA